MPGIPDLRNAQQSLTRLAESDLDVLWRQLTNAVEARIALQDILPDLVNMYGSAAAAVAADWYDGVRAEADVRGGFRAIPAVIEDGATDALALWATSAGDDLDSIRTLVEGGLQRRILNWSRRTVMGSATADRSAEGWQREGFGECRFCDMLIGRGAVYSESTAEFASHDHCRCQAVPAFEGEPRPVKPYTPSARGSTEADRARVRAWIAKNR